jgi:DNA polymerase III epsilon subunit-like protein
VKYLSTYKTFEHKFWYKTISEFLSYIEEKSNKYWIFIDTETTGLPSDPYEIQLTQLSCIVCRYDANKNKFQEIDEFNQKIKLTNNTIELMKGDTRIQSVLDFNHYGEGGNIDEQKSLSEFFNFVSKYKYSVFVIQNAAFDMRFLNTRSKLKFKNEVIDTKQILQLYYLPLIQKLAESDSKYEHLVSKIGTSERDNGLISSSMSKIGPALGINMTGYHDALTDCRLAMQMFIGIIDELKNNISIDISKYQRERINTI